MVCRKVTHHGLHEHEWKDLLRLEPYLIKRNSKIQLVPHVYLEVLCLRES